MIPPIDETSTRQAAYRQVHLRDYWKIVWQGRWTIVAVFLLVVGITAVWTFLRTPIYRATAVIEVQPKAQQVTSGQDVSGLGAAGYGWFAENKYHNTQVEIIRSRAVAKRAFESLGLGSNPAFSQAADPIESFRQRIEVVPRRETGLIEVSISGAQPDEITQWVNEVADAYVQRNIDVARDKTKDAFEMVQGQIDVLRRDFSDLDAERLTTLEDTGIYDSEGQKSIISDKLKTYNTELSKAQIKMRQLGDTLDAIRNMLNNNADLMTLPELASDPQLEEFQRTKIEIERRLETAKVEFRPDHPTYEGLVGELNTIKQSMKNRISEIFGAMQTQYELAEQEASYLKDQIRDVRTDSLKFARNSGKVELIDSQTEMSKRIFDVINKTMTEIQVNARLLTNNVQKLDDAVPPLYPVKPRKKINLAIGGFIGLFLGIAAAFFLDYLDNTFRTPDDIEKYLGTAVLGVIPRLQDEDGVDARAVKEAYQSLRTSVIFASKNRRRKVVLLTSTGPQEGKSSTAANLGRALAASGDRVMLLDCDLRRPTQNFIHKLDRDHGMTNYLAEPEDRADWSSYVKTAGPSTLHVMTSGPIPPNPPDLLGSERFRALIDELRAKYDWVLIDSPPAASLADSTLLASMADMIILVVQHFRTDRDLVAKTLRRLQGVNPAIAGAVLNNVDLDRTYHKDYYYAGYYYLNEDEVAAGGKRPRRHKDTEPTARVG